MSHVRMVLKIILVVITLITHVHPQCCPDEAWGNLNNDDYEVKGTIETLEFPPDTRAGVASVNNLDIYKVGSSDKCIIWNYDIFGLRAGRTQQMADFLAAHGYLVLIPDYYRGVSFDPNSNARHITLQFLTDQSKWANNGQLYQDYSITKSYAKDNLGCKTFGTIGTCWGTYAVLRMSEDVDIKAAVSMHPSHPSVLAILGEEEKTCLKDIKCPQLYLPSEHDSETVKKDGLSKQILGDALEIVEFPDMKHGWTIRGDLNEKNVDRDVKKAFNLVLSFFKKYL
eukprot:05975.XXX_109968_110940_1 [CDS] Oithona nana genome sequencing.